MSDRPEFEVMERPEIQQQDFDKDGTQGEATTDHSGHSVEPSTPNEKLHELLQTVGDYSLETATDATFALLTCQDFPALQQAKTKLSVKSKDMKIDVFFCARINAMIGTLDLYLDSTLSYGWKEASMLAAKASGHGVYCARCIRRWIHQFLTSGKLLLHRYGHSHSVLEDEDLSQAIQLHLQERAKDGYIRAEDIVDFLSSPEMQEQFSHKKINITIRTARNWLHTLEW
ncbi:hypothetical protein M422DRAFT_255176 [Sphaerobolus stellatus SS14]|uniref:Uncharacterized protein n=1 Tax=Sphaerobolus stellatus (strain SS14) TaxID=990650 RepID=A0A0C9VUE3_SPHS4|nr:hypothetical protein M422DRAFT_255176 [Sphaerobolus stellatus SS14]